MRQPARWLYQGNLFQLTRAYLEDPRVPMPDGRPPLAIVPTYIHAWGILSAKHGLVMPDDVLDPYDQRLEAGMESEWSDRVLQQLTDRWGLGTIYTTFAGANYGAINRRLPFVEDAFGHWLRRRREDGLRTRVGNGWLMKQLKEGRNWNA